MIEQADRQRRERRREGERERDGGEMKKVLEERITLPRGTDREGER